MCTAQSSRPNGILFCFFHVLLSLTTNYLSSSKELKYRISVGHSQGTSAICTRTQPTQKGENWNPYSNIGLALNREWNQGTRTINKFFYFIWNNLMQWIRSILSTLAISPFRSLWNSCTFPSLVLYFHNSFEVKIYLDVLRRKEKPLRSSICNGLLQLKWILSYSFH